MFQENYVIILAVILILGVIIFAVLKPKARPATEAPSTQNASATLPLQLQAYERLVILTERMGLRHLLGSYPTEGLSAREYQVTLVEAIKAEYDYNVSQQIYVAPKAWEAISNLKEQNIYVLNQIGSYLNGEASGRDLARAVAEYLSGQETGALQQVVTEALTIEAQKLMR